MDRKGSLTEDDAVPNDLRPPGGELAPVVGVFRRDYVTASEVAGRERWVGGWKERRGRAG